MKAIILAGGFGTRTHGLTHETPAGLCEIEEKTLLDQLMLKLEPIHAIGDVLIVTNGLHYLDFFRWRMQAPYQKRIHIETNQAYVPEKRNGVIKDLFLGLLSHQVPQDDCLLLFSNRYFDFPIGHFLLPCLGHREAGFVGISASENGWIHMDNDGRIRCFEARLQNRGTYSPSGVFFFPKSFMLRIYEYLEMVRLEPDDFKHFIFWLAEKEPLYGIEFTERCQSLSVRTPSKQSEETLEEKKR
ncbi:MAG: hypothetical protein COV74_01340 [Candidatus Omnitrophica bacterium CG11_big_fil_rev_8_21_14_0_20_45_26]|uniref:Nucleotidyl transferase domain-containing protein n=1 Tax=Candidatus Abzuiibacterium crystallinum TaxID=1974748 RepID=A0A2H0LU41_9BACT|nr:MAG: hypothetical protein COV74_01340 [Candidatus Omnitrophica bacterium CG11_big_fil_rev_8_21_14_0_20_45_26]PIW64814.1 MAG: hypothetical protein COW12_04750 [Candidatus Omnitrophica bacterium CG12_big_fil_rev_8_21_14_0_65_45_16]